MIVTDLVMPVLDGFGLVRQLRQLGYEKLPIVASSASVTEADQAESLIAGCNYFLPKPVDFEQLLACLQQYLQLTWIYEQKAEVSAPATVTEWSDLLVPPVELLNTLGRAAKIGDFGTVEAEIACLRQLDPRYAAFCDRLSEYAAEFDDQAILDWLNRPVQSAVSR
ncbi:MAG: response regulator [Spirulinaceae cyanobacterium RM2_2_10]|nr:response regulator [Spirulinaceae cyanobacterium RM2_2_10]